METFKIKAYGIAELAAQYSPASADSTARKKLNHWIDRYPGLRRPSPWATVPRPVSSPPPKCAPSWKPSANHDRVPYGQKSYKSKQNIFINLYLFERFLAAGDS